MVHVALFPRTSHFLSFHYRQPLITFSVEILPKTGQFLGFTEANRRSCPLSSILDVDWRKFSASYTVHAASNSTTKPSISVPPLIKSFHESCRGLIYCRVACYIHRDLFFQISFSRYLSGSLFLTQDFDSAHQSTSLGLHSLPDSTRNSGFFPTSEPAAGSCSGLSRLLCTQNQRFSFFLHSLPHLQSQCRLHYFTISIVVYAFFPCWVFFLSQTSWFWSPLLVW